MSSLDKVVFVIMVLANIGMWVFAGWGVRKIKCPEASPHYGFLTLAMLVGGALASSAVLQLIPLFLPIEMVIALFILVVTVVGAFFLGQWLCSWRKGPVCS